MSEQARFGAELRRRREDAGISLAHLAQRVHYSKGHLSKVEAGHKPPSVQLARLCDAAVGAGGALVRLVGGGLPPGNDARVPQTTAEAQDVWVVGVGPDGSGYFTPTSRDDVPAAVGMTFGSDRVRADTATVLIAFLARFEVARNLGQVAGPAVVLPVVIAETQTLRGLADNAPPDERAALLRLASRYAEFAGWMTQEAGDDRMALWWTNTAVRMAVRGGDHDLKSYAMVRRADIALHSDDALSTIALAKRAQQDESVPVRVRGLAAQREGQGHALAGDYDACLRALERSAGLLEEAARADPPGPALGTTKTPELAALVGGWCLHDLGKPAEAADILDRGIAQFAPDAHRARVRYATRAALAYATAGELDRACELATSLLDHVEVLDSATIRHDLRYLARVLARWRTHAEVKALRPRLAEVLRVPTGVAGEV